MIKITNTIQRDAAHADGNEILAVKKLLFRSGHYDIPDYGLTEYPDQALFSAIKKFQKDKGLNIDGVIKPDGETLKALNYQTLPGNGSDELEGTPLVRGPILRCPKCGAPHGGSSGEECPDCAIKD